MQAMRLVRAARSIPIRNQLPKLPAETERCIGSGWKASKPFCCELFRVSGRGQVGWILVSFQRYSLRPSHPYVLVRST